MQNSTTNNQYEKAIEASSTQESEFFKGFGGLLLVTLVIAYVYFSIDVAVTAFFIDVPGNTRTSIFIAENYFYGGSSVDYKINYLRNPDCEDYWLRVPNVDGVVKVSDKRGVTIHHPEEILSVIIDGEEFGLSREWGSNFEKKLENAINQASEFAWKDLSQRAFFKIDVWIVTTGVFLAFCYVLSLILHRERRDFDGV